MGQNRFEKMIHKLLTLDDETWGNYAFTRELLNKRISAGKREVMIYRAMECGREYAKRIIREYGTRDVRAIARILNVEVVYQKTSMAGKRILFACYTPPDKIEIMTEPVSQAVQLISKADSNLVELFLQDGIMDTILGHEVFHRLEEEYGREIYTRTEKILLWNFMGFKNYSTIRVLGEIGAMAFTKELNGLSYSPFLLDILLYYGYDTSGAEKMYREVLGMSSGRCRETVENFK
ncbi:hypothetical protein acsn021_34620 [Anaerocolumna cellulosilytica]|uniref:Uncharacterized protein n=1 Tax=Anaerocolumna cellulosilytica TaxID=433286 RepID=A0A6S6QXF3_9FIRM|nr:hypothetical protein [Anaerocolumna cellulosilytica]MBB5195360.1 hypothetical protein [Anaerocolumna cellulosilytica]BCJ95893.1 hypothetical protein acsn021_34620 [Anaerocolumna cellulosilytica]